MSYKVMKSSRQQLIEKIMINKYGNDTTKYDARNLIFLESLTLKQLEDLVGNSFNDEEL